MNSSRLVLNDAYIYVIKAFKIECLNKEELAWIQSGHPDESLLENSAAEVVEYLAEERKFRLLCKKDSKDFIPAIQNYCKIDNTRLSSFSQKENVFIRVQIAKDQLATLQKTFGFLGENSKIIFGMLLFFSTGVGIFTIKIRLQNSDEKTLCLCSRRENTEKIAESLEQFYRQEISGNSSWPSLCSKMDSDLFISTIIRDTGYTQGEIMPFVEENVESLYSLYTGLDFQGQYTSRESLHKFLEENLSTRKDTFFTLNFSNALIVESLWKRENFTRNRLSKEASEIELASREEYNDLNYIIWLELLVYQRYLLELAYQEISRFGSSPIEKQTILEIENYQEQMNTWIHNLEGSKTTIYRTYQKWMEHGRSVMGIDARYQMFNERIDRINKNIQSRYQAEQIDKQNKLSSICVLLSILALYFAGLDFLKNMFDILQNRKLVPWLVTYEIEIYCFCFIALIGIMYFTRKFRKNKAALKSAPKMKEGEKTVAPKPCPLLSSVGVIRNEKGEILLIQRKYSPFEGKWAMPGGRIAFGESITEGVLREVKEEVGLKGETGNLLAFKESLPSAENKEAHFAMWFYEIKVAWPQEVRMGKEVSNFAWVNSDNYKNYDIAPKTKEVLDKILVPQS